MNRFYLTLGDWSDDGHGRVEKILLQSESTKNEVMQAYLEGCKITGVALHDDSRFSTIASAHGDANLYAEEREKLEAHGFDAQALTLVKYVQYDGDPIRLGTADVLRIFEFLVQVGSWPDEIELTSIEEVTPSLNGYWDKDFNFTIAYGLFG